MKKILVLLFVLFTINIVSAQKNVYLKYKIVDEEMLKPFKNTQYLINQKSIVLKTNKNKKINLKMEKIKMNKNYFLKNNFYYNPLIIYKF